MHFVQPTTNSRQLTDDEKGSFQLPSSICFSPAGLLLCTYHLGVASVIQSLIPNDETAAKIQITGVSAGAVTAIAVKLRIPLDSILNLLMDIGEKKEADDRISLVDEVESCLPRVIKENLGGTADHGYENYDNERFHKLSSDLRIGISHRRSTKHIISGKKFNGEAFCYIDQFRNIDDLVAACVISCYIPGGTGPKLGKLDPNHLAVARCSILVKEMECLGFIKTIKSNEPVNARKSMMQLRGAARRVPSINRRESYRDGGLAQCLPTIDKNTLLVCPMAVEHADNPAISPACTCDGKRRRLLAVLPRKLKFTKSTLKVCQCTLDTVNLVKSRVIRDEDIERIYAQGRNNAIKEFESSLDQRRHTTG